MRIKCPYCGERDQREFTIKGALADLPKGDAFDASWNDFLHVRDNPEGVSVELWQHTGGCGAWLIVTRNTRTHEVLDVVPARPEAVQ